MNALLAHPRFPVTHWGFQYGLRLIGKRASLPPLGLITIAALLPAHWHVRLVDLNLDVLRDDDLRWADMALTGGLLIQVESMQEIIARARAFQVPVAVGGPAPTTSPELFDDADVDSVVLLARTADAGRKEKRGTVGRQFGQEADGATVADTPALRRPLIGMPWI